MSVPIAARMWSKIVIVWDGFKAASKPKHSPTSCSL
jgi:hypothetical protein